MPPKKKKGGKAGKGKAAKKGMIIDGLPVADMTKEQLEGHLTRIRDELEREREERNFYQLERDKVKNYWDIVKKELNDTKKLINQKDQEILKLEQEFNDKIQLYIQKGKFLQFEHQRVLEENNTEGLTLQKINEQNQKELEQFINDLYTMHTKSKAEESNFLETINSMKEKNLEEISHLKQEFKCKIQDMQVHYTEKLQHIKDELNLQRRSEIHEIEERKNNQMEDLIKAHEKSFADIKQYYTDIILNNLALINTLKDDLDTLKSKEERTEKKMHEISQENRRLAEPLRKAQEELNYLRRQMKLYEQDKLHLANAKANVENLNKSLDELKWENSVLQENFEKLDKERKALFFNFKSALEEVKAASNVKNLVLEKKLETLKEKLGIDTIELTDYIEKAPPHLVAGKIEDTAAIIEEKNKIIKKLEIDLARVCKEYNDLKRYFEARLKKLGLLKKDEALVPLDISIHGFKLGKGPPITSVN